MANIQTVLKRRRMARIRFVAIAFLGALVLSTIGVSTFAWFTTNRSAKTTYSQIVARDPTILGTPTYYRYVRPASAQEGDPYYFAKITDNTFDIGAYRDKDLLGESSYRMLIQIPVLASFDRVVAFARSDRPTILEPRQEGDSSSWGWPSTFEESSAKANSLTNPLSAVIAFASYADSEINQTLQEVTTEEGQTYSCLSIPKKKAVKGFVDVDVSTAPVTLTYAPQGYLEIPSGENEVQLTLDGARNVWLMLDYNAEAVTSLYTDNIGNALFEEGMLSSDGERLGYVAYYRDFTLSVKEGE